LSCDHARYDVITPGCIGRLERERRRCRVCGHTWRTLDAHHDHGLSQALAYFDRETRRAAEGAGAP
jgi:hypothetical protein